MALEKTTKHIILIVSALVFITTAIIFAAKKESIERSLNSKMPVGTCIHFSTGQR